MMKLQPEPDFLLYKKIWGDVAPQYTTASYAATNNDAAVMFRAIASLFNSQTQKNAAYSDARLDADIEHLSSHFPGNLAPLFEQLAKTYLQALHQKLKQ
jgi:hypothetical protein